MIGADNGDTTIERIQLDTLGNMAIGGKSTDSHFISTASSASMQSFAKLLLSPTFDYLWAVAFNIYNQDMRDMQFRPGADDQIMIFIGSNVNVVLPTYLFIISASTGAILKQATINPATQAGNGRAFFDSLGRINFVSSDNIGQTMFSVLDLSNSATTSYNFAKVTAHYEISYTLIQGKPSLGCFYASVFLDSGSLIGSSGAGYGIIKLVTSPSISSTWDYFWHNHYLTPQN